MTGYVLPGGFNFEPDAEWQVEISCKRLAANLKPLALNLEVGVGKTGLVNAAAVFLWFNLFPIQESRRQHHNQTNQTAVA